MSKEHNSTRRTFLRSQAQAQSSLESPALAAVILKQFKFRRTSRMLSVPVFAMLALVLALSASAQEGGGRFNRVWGERYTADRANTITNTKAVTVTGTVQS